MENLDQKLAIEKEKRIRDASLKLAEQSTREGQRLHAVKTAFTSKIRADSIRSDWQTCFDDESGATIELSDVVIPFIQFQKKDYRRACYVIAKCGATVIDSELFIVTRLVPELKIPTKFRFQKVASDFKLILQVYGRELADKPRLKDLSPRAKFDLWAQVELSLPDMTNRLKFHTAQLTSMAPSVPRLYGTISGKLCGQVPILSETIYEGFLNVWTATEESTDSLSAPQWRLVWVTLRNGHFKGYDDPRTQSTILFDIEVTGELNIRPMVNGRRYAFDLRDFSGRTVLAANCQADMDRAISMLKNHKHHLKRWGRLIGSSQLDESNIEGTPSKPKWSSNFLGSKKRRSRSVEHNTPRIERSVGKTGQINEETSNKIISEIINDELRKSRRNKRRSKSVDNRKKYQSPPRMPNMEDTVKSLENDLYVSDSQPRSLPTPNYYNADTGPKSMPAMVNMLSLNENRRNDLMRTSTKIANPELRDKYQDLSDLSPISSPVSTIEKVGLSPIPAARLISPTKKQSRDSFANAMRNKH